MRLYEVRTYASAYGPALFESEAGRTLTEKVLAASDTEAVEQAQAKAQAFWDRNEQPCTVVSAMIIAVSNEIPSR